MLWDYPENDIIIFKDAINTVNTINEVDINNLIKEVQTDIEIEKLEKRYKKLTEEIDILNKQEDEEDNNNNSNNNQGAVALTCVKKLKIQSLS